MVETKIPGYWEQLWDHVYWSLYYEKFKKEGILGETKRHTDGTIEIWSKNNMPLLGFHRKNNRTRIYLVWRLPHGQT